MSTNDAAELVVAKELASRLDERFGKWFAEEFRLRGEVVLGQDVPVPVMAGPPYLRLAPRAKLTARPAHFHCELDATRHVRLARSDPGVYEYHLRLDTCARRH